MWLIKFIEIMQFEDSFVNSTCGCHLKSKRGNTFDATDIHKSVASGFSQGLIPNCALGGNMHAMQFPFAIATENEITWTMELNNPDVLI